MEKLNANGKLVLAALLALTAALPLACGSDDSKGIPPGGDAGEAGEGGSGAKSGAGGRAGSAQAGGAQGGKAGAGTAGAPEAGAPDNMGGAGGSADMGGAGGSADVGGTGGAEEMGGAAGDTGVDPYEANVDTTCTTTSSLDCSDTGAAADKQTCLENAAGQLDSAPTDCLPAIKALVACLATEPATSFHCVEGSAFPNDDVCTDQNSALNDCYGAHL